MIDQGRRRWCQSLPSAAAGLRLNSAHLCLPGPIATTAPLGHTGRDYYCAQLWHQILELLAGGKVRFLGLQ